MSHFDTYEYFQTVWDSPRARVNAFLEQCTCMNEEDQAVLSMLLDDIGPEIE